MQSVTVPAVAVSSILVVAAIAFFIFQPARAFDPQLPWHDKVSFWEHEIAQYGADEAYERFATTVEPLSYEDKHTQAHAFGAALFSEVGKDGITTCDARFSFGCYHQFLGDAIARLGLGSIVSLNDACQADLAQTKLSCQHGIGHGALAAIGYDEAALMQALDLCHNLPGIDPIGGCYGGVFMEYNVRTMLAEAATARDFTGNEFDPCDVVDDEYVAACIYWQPQWWLTTERAHDLEDVFARMGSQCRSFAHDEQLQRTCFEGIGNIVTQASGFDPSVARHLCDRAGEAQKEKTFCRAIGANHFGIDVHADAAHAVCENLPENDRAFCLAYAANTGNVANELPLD